MNSPLAVARADGWTSLAGRLTGGVHRRVRDALRSRKLRSPGFRAGRAPRLLGLSHMRIGEDFHAGDALWLEAVLRYGDQMFSPQLTVGPHARLSDNVHIGCLDRITLGAHLLCGSRVLISDHAHGRYSGADGSDPQIPPALRSLHSAAPVFVGDNVWLGDGVAVLAGAHIGDGCVIGANSVVTGAIPARTIAVGAPARAIRQWSETKRAWIPVPAPAES